MGREPRRARQRGQGLVEFALVLPILLLMVWGVMEFGRLLYLYSEVSNAAREAVRYGIAGGDDPTNPRFNDCEGIRNTARDAAVLSGLEADDVQISYDDGATLIGTCPANPEDIGFGDRLVVTVTKEISTLVLFQGAGPFRLQFGTARTIPKYGIPTTGLVGGLGRCSLAPPAMSFEFEPYCSYDHGEPLVQFSWGSVAGAAGYNLYLEGDPEPLAAGLPPDVFQYPVPDDTYVAVVAGGYYYVRPYDSQDLECVFSNSVEIDVSQCVPRVLPPSNFGYHDDNPPGDCIGHFYWSHTGALGYRLYQNGVLFVDGIPGADQRYPAEGITETFESAMYTLSGYDAGGEGPPSDPEQLVLGPGCGAADPLIPPTNLAFTQTVDACHGYFTWTPGSPLDARFGLGFDPLDPEDPPYFVDQDITARRFPEAAGEDACFADGRYWVYAYRPILEWSDPSAPVDRLEGCDCALHPVDITYYFHTSPTPPTGHGDSPPPLTMDGNPPTSAVLYNYSGSQSNRQGREVKSGGVSPPSGDEDRYLAWTVDLANQLTIVEGTAQVTLWGNNPSNVELMSAVALLVRVDGSWKTLGGSAAIWPRVTPAAGSWDQRVVSVPVQETAIPAGSRLMVWVTVPSGSAGKRLSLAYDTVSYPSGLELTGAWGP